MFRRIREHFQRRTQKKSKEDPQVKALQEELEGVAREMEECKKMEKKRMEEKDVMVKKVAELKTILASEQKHQRDMKERNARLQQNITELQASLKLCEEQEKTAKLERESLMRDREQLEKHVAQLEASLASEQKKWEQERKKTKSYIEERNTAHLQKIIDLQASLKLCEEREKSAELERQSLMRDREQLEKHVAQLEASLASEQKKHEQERKKTKLDIEERKASHLQDITELQASLKLCEEQEKSAELERQSLMRDREQLEKHVAQLEASLASERKKQEQEKEKTKLYTEEGNTAHVQKIFDLQASLKLCEEREKSAELERQSLMRNRERLEKNVAQLETTLSSERKKREQEREKAKLYMEERNAAHLQNINGLQASLKLCEEREKTAVLERQSLMRDREHLEKHVVQLEATLSSERKKQEQERKKAELDIEERNTAHLQKITELQASLKLCEEREKTAELERENLMKDREHLEKHVVQLEASLVSERKKRKQEKEKAKLCMEERNTAHVQKITKLQASLKLCEEREKSAVLERESLMRNRERLIKNFAQLEASLASERKKREQEREKAKLYMEERNTAHVQKITELQASLKLCEEREKTAELERQSLMRDREHLEKHVAQLEATLSSERKKHEQERDNTNLDIKERKTILLQNMSKLQASLKICEEQQKIAEQGRERRMKARERLEKIAQLVASLTSARGQQEQENEKIKLHMEERKASHLQDITELQASLKLCEEREKSAELERQSLMRDQERREKHVAQPEATLASEREQHKQEKKRIKLGSEKITAALLQKITKLQVFLELSEEEQKKAELESKRRMRDHEQLKKFAEREHRNQGTTEDQAGCLQEEQQPVLGETPEERVLMCQ